MTGAKVTYQQKEEDSSIIRVLEIIEAISHVKTPISPDELSRSLEISNANTHILLQQLKDHNYVQVNIHGLLVPGDRMHGIAIKVMHSRQLKALRQSILKNSRELLEKLAV